MTNKELLTQIVDIIKKNPGISRSELLIEMENPHISDQELTNCLTTLRRRGWTENQGTRKNPKWYAQEVTPQNPSPRDELDDIFRQSEERLARSLEYIRNEERSRQKHGI